MSRALVALGATALCGGAGGCVQTTTHHPVGAGNGTTLHPVPMVASWDVLEHERTIGSVLRFEATAAHAERAPADSDQAFLYIVRNQHGQDIGAVDALGRAWRRRPHAPDEQLGAGTLEAGVRRILGAGPGARITAREAPSSSDAPESGPSVREAPESGPSVREAPESGPRPAAEGDVDGAIDADTRP
ncbi:MAG: hypothetical protein R3F49_13460 [Planctomycetota bacterium]